MESNVTVPDLDIQTDDFVEDAVPVSAGVAPSVSDFPVDYGNPGMADDPDPAFDDVVDEDDEDDTPDPDEPEPDDEDEDDEDDDMDEGEEPVVPPGIEKGQTAEPDEEFDNEPEE